jgi:hypothetical protein
VRLARSGRYALLTLSLGLGACSWLPWHKKHPAVESAMTPVAATSVHAPSTAASQAPISPTSASAAVSAPASTATSASSSVAGAASVAAPVVPPAGADVAAQFAPIAPTHDNAVSGGQYAPLNEREWRDLFGKYQQLAQCEDRYMNSAGLNSAGVAQRLVLMNKAGALRADALRLLDANSPLRAQWTAATATQAEQQSVLINQTLMVLMGDAGPQTGLGRTLARKAVARFYVSLVTGTVCPVDSKYQVLMRKAAS